MVGIILIVGAEIFMDVKKEAAHKRADDMFMIDQRLNPLFLEINNFPRGPGQDVVFLSRLSSLKKYVSSPQPGDATRDKVLMDFETYRKQSAAYADIKYFPVDCADKGKFCVASPGEDSAYHCAECEYFNEMSDRLGDGEVHISRMHRNYDSDRSVQLTRLHYMASVFDDGGSFQGSVVLSIDADYFLDDIRAYSKTDEAVYLIDDKGMYIANTDRSKEFATGEDGQGLFMSDYPDVSEKIVSSSGQRVENSQYIFSIKKIYPTVSSFEAYEGSKSAQDNSDSGYWILVSACKKTIAHTGYDFFLYEDFWASSKGVVFIIVLFLLAASFIIAEYLKNKCSLKKKNT
ncbi:MAG: hypothetical protein HGB08_02995 [Candidatus Moranbacteria bacterium]|nr:hypothetical protein [Candidatus Moranbacteria bacterium]